jgi:hypothetical protein
MSGVDMHLMDMGVLCSFEAYKGLLGWLSHGLLRHGLLWCAYNLYGAIWSHGGFSFIDMHLVDMGVLYLE